nr:MAG: maturation protein [Leviviridae sp.]
MRLRIRQDTMETSTTPNWYTDGGTYIIGPTPMAYTKAKVFKAMADVVTPRYKELERNGNIVNSPMEMVSYKFSAEPSILEGQGICGGRTHLYRLSDVPVIGPSFNASTWQATLKDVLDGFSDESEIAQTKAWSDIDVSEIQGAASLGELPETVEWLVDRLKELAKLVRAIRRRDLATLRKLFKQTKKQDTYLNVWLEYRFAIRPLVNDILAALKALDAILSKGQRFTARGVFLEKTGPVSSQSQVPFTNPALAATFLGYVADKTVQTTLLCRAGVLVEIDHSINTGMALWGLDNPLEAVYELITLSFLVDWIFNIGNVLSAMLLNPGLTPRASWVTEEFTSVTDLKVLSYWHTNTPGCSQNIVEQHLTTFGSAYEELTLKRRVPLTKRYSFPHLNVRLDPGKILDIYAIAKNFLR